jgi:hypothetical protein
MKSIIITSTVYYEEVRSFKLTDELYEKYINKIEGLSFDDDQEDLIQIYEELEDDSIEDSLLETNPLSLPEVINTITF